ncbi:3-hydroxyacyl-ACP dehydratase [Niabella insulamsoli]|uniref:3-hydroxyacyl-ACP dehydratase n=1 Tax=Niabella insulamsoli TaxID=3144874 RepID=UPI0031FDAF56
MLVEQLYEITQFNSDSKALSATLSINAAHPIFEGHFPNQPVLPGVCQVQIVKELLEQAVQKKLQLSAAAQCKFLQMVDPRSINNIEVNIKYDLDEKEVACNAVLQSEEKIFLKMNGTFTIV